MCVCVFMEIDQCAVTVHLVQAFEVEMFDTAAVFVLGNCLNDLCGVRGHTTTQLIQGMPRDLTEDCVCQSPPHTHTQNPSHQIYHSISSLYYPKTVGDRLKDAGKEGEVMCLLLDEGLGFNLMQLAVLFPPWFIPFLPSSLPSSFLAPCALI